ncbi:MAG: MGMT family protein [Actinomycetia bacterium]|nr:MGMT family protein [Actinomycetes bacterium]
MNGRDEHIIDVIRALREGEVVTYGDIAADAGYPKLSRLVGRILATTDEELPWWRVVNSVGRLVPGHEREQAALLRAERVTVGDGRVRHARVGRFSRPKRS